MKKLIRSFFFFSSIFMLYSNSLLSITRTSAGDGNWNSTTPSAPWPSGIVPSATDDVVIRPGDDITVTANATINSISFANSGGTGTTRTFTVNTGVVLTVTAGITLRNGAGSDYSSTIAGGGTINCASFTLGRYVSPTADATTTMTSTISNLSISGNLNINGVKNSSNENNSTFNLGSGSVSVGGTVVLDADYGGVGFASSATLTLATGSQNGILTLLGATPFSIPGTGTATFTANGTSATVIYSGSNQQVRSTIYTNLTVSGSGTKTLDGATTVNGTLALTSGNLTTTTTNLLTLGSSATVSGGSSSSFVDGPMACTGTGSKTFPIGKSNSYRPVTLGSITGTSPVIRAEVFNSGPGGTPGTGLTKISSVRYWQLNLNSGSFTSSTINLTYGSDDGVTDAAYLRVAQSPTLTGTYTNRNGTGSANGSGNITSSSISTLGYFTLANATGGNNPVPVELTSFTASAKKLLGAFKLDNSNRSKQLWF